MSRTEQTMTLPEAARALSLSWGQCWRLALRGQLVIARQDGRGRYHVTTSSVERLKNGRHRAPRVPQPAARVS